MPETAALYTALQPARDHGTHKRSGVQMWTGVAQAPFSRVGDIPPTTGLFLGKSAGSQTDNGFRTYTVHGLKTRPAGRTTGHDS